MLKINPPKMGNLIKPKTLPVGTSRLWETKGESSMPKHSAKGKTHSMMPKSKYAHDDEGLA